MHGLQGISLPLADPEACCIALESLQACLCKQLPVPAARCTASLPKRKRRKDYAFWRQSNEKPSIIPGCLGACQRHLLQGQAAVFEAQRRASLEQDQQGVFGGQAEALKRPCSSSNKHV